MDDSSQQLNTSRITVITRTKDRPWMLERAVKSVLAQTNPNWYHVIVNDAGDVFALDKMLSAYGESYKGRLKVIHLKENVGMMKAANKALEEVNTEFVCVHDDDDSWEASFLDKALGFLDDKGPKSLYQGVITYTNRIWEKVEGTTLSEIRREAYQALAEVSLYRVGFENPYPPISFVFRTSVLDKIGKLNPSFSYAADLDFNIRFLSHYEVGVIKEPLANYHWREEGSGQNTVTEQANVHGILLNEVLNHYLREQINGKSNELGLALNNARYAVNTQGRVEAVLERIKDLKLAVSDEAKLISTEQLDQLKGIRDHLSSFNSLLEDIPADRHAVVSDQLQGIRDHLSSFNSLLEDIPADRHAIVSDQLQGIRDHLSSFNSLLEDIPADRHAVVSDQLQGIRDHLSSFNSLLEDIPADRHAIVSDQLQGIRDHLSSFNSLLEDIPSDRHAIVSDQLQGIRDHLSSFNSLLEDIPADRHAIVSDQLQDLKVHLSSFNGLLDELPRSRYESIIKELKRLDHKLNTDLDSISSKTGVFIEKSSDLKTHLSSISDALFGDTIPLTKTIHEKVTQQLPENFNRIEDKLNLLESKIETHKKSWKIGPLRVYWQPKTKKSDK